jgi:hypothetical protein
MSTIKKAIILMILLAIFIPIIHYSKLISWISPRDNNPANIFQTIGVNEASIIASIGEKKETVETPTPVLQEPQTNKSFVAPQKPYRILIMGDSLIAVAGGVGEILEQKLIAIGGSEVLREGKVSSGLMRPDYFDWQKESLTLTNSFTPNIAIVMMGTNDAQSIDFKENGTKKLLSYGSHEWDNEYANRVKAFNNQLTNRGVTVYWIGLPAMRDAPYAGRIRHLNELNEAAGKENPQVKYISAEDLMAGDKTAYQAFMPDENGVMKATRIADGIHLSYFGSTYLVGKVIDILKKDVDLSETVPE